MDEEKEYLQILKDHFIALTSSSSYYLFNISHCVCQLEMAYRTDTILPAEKVKELCQSIYDSTNQLTNEMDRSVKERNALNAARGANRIAHPDIERLKAYLNPLTSQGKYDLLTISCSVDLLEDDNRRNEILTDDEKDDLYVTIFKAMNHFSNLIDQGIQHTADLFPPKLR